MNEKKKKAALRKWSTIAAYGFLATTKLYAFSPEAMEKMGAQLVREGRSSVNLQQKEGSLKFRMDQLSNRPLSQLYVDYTDGYSDTYSDPDYYYTDQHDYYDYQDYYNYSDYYDYQDYYNYSDYYDYSDYSDYYSDGVEGSPY